GFRDVPEGVATLDGVRLGRIRRGRFGRIRRGRRYRSGRLLRVQDLRNRRGDRDRRRGNGTGERPALPTGRPHEHGVTPGESGKDKTPRGANPANLCGWTIRLRKGKRAARRASRPQVASVTAFNRWDRFLNFKHPRPPASRPKRNPSA